MRDAAEASLPLTVLHDGRSSPFNPLKGRRERMAGASLRIEAPGPGLDPAPILSSNADASLQSHECQHAVKFSTDADFQSGE